MRSPRTRLVAALAVAPVIFLGACSTNGSGDGSTDATKATSDTAADAATATTGDDAAATSGAADSDVSALAVKKGKDGKPEITWDGKAFSKGDLPFSVSQTTSEEVKAGKGSAVAEGDDVVVRYLAVNGKDGKKRLSTFDKDETVTMSLSNERLFPAFANELVGRKPGEAFIMAAPPADAFGEQGNANLGVGGEDTLVFYVEVVSTGKPLTKAEGQAVAPKAGLPTVKADGESAAKIDVKGADKPTSLVSQLLIKGEGPKVQAGQTIKVHYTGVDLKDGKEFDSSYSRNEPAEFAIGVGQVITGWDEGLVGKPVGSRVLLVVPAKDAYGTDSKAHELGGKDLVFVVDILGAY